MRVLLFTLFAPLVAYGDHGARTARRGSWARPTRTATLGLVAAALGIERSAHDDHFALHNGLGFAVRVDSTGRSLTDYHTFQVGIGVPVVRVRADELSRRTKTTITHREYRTDALHTVGLWTKPDCAWTLEVIQAALRHPHWLLYCGRRCAVPALPLQPEIVHAPTVPDAFNQRPPLPQAIAKDMGLRLDANPILATDVGAPGVKPVREEQRRDGYHHTNGDLRTFVDRREWIMECPRPALASEEALR